jgi:rod shape-determining protein MreB
VTIGSNEITECFSFPLQQIAIAVKNVLEKTPPELSSDVLDKGIVLSGGTALLKNLDKYLTNFAGVPVHIADEPLNAVINGISKVLDNLSYFEKSLLRK